MTCGPPVRKKRVYTDEQRARRLQKQRARRAMLTEEEKERVRSYQKDWYASLPEEHRQKYRDKATRTYHSTYAAVRKARYCPDEARENHLIKTYGLTESDWWGIFDSQEFRCAVCKDEEPRGGKWCVDHCHVSGQVRGILCNECNTGLGKFSDNPALLRAAEKYLIQACEVKASEADGGKR